MKEVSYLSSSTSLQSGLFSTVDALKFLQVLFCKNGVLEAMGPGKSFVDLSTIDVETASDADEVCYILIF